MKVKHQNKHEEYCQAAFSFKTIQSRHFWFLFFISLFCFYLLVVDIGKGR